MKKSNLWLSFFWVALSLFVCIYTYRLGLGQVTNPGPGLYPFCVGVVLFILSCAVLIKTPRQAAGAEEKKDEQTSLRKALLALVVLFAYAFLLETLGYLVVTFLAMALLFKIGGYDKILPITAYSLATVIVSYLMFTYLGVQFPPGIFRFLTFI